MNDKEFYIGLLQLITHLLHNMSYIMHNCTLHTGQLGQQTLEIAEKSEYVISSEKFQKFSDEL